MPPNSESSTGVLFVAIDVAKQIHEVLIEPPTGGRQRWRMVNCQRDYDLLRQRLQAFQTPVRIGFEATGTYHRPLAYFLHQCGFELRLISSLAVARTRDALYNSWDKNDPKDTQVLLHWLKTEVTQRYHDPLVHAVNDLQEFAQTHYQVSLRKVRVQHSIMTHYLPLYFPEADRYYTNSRAQWFTRLLHRFPCRPLSPATSVRPLSKKPGPSSGGRSINTGSSTISMSRRVRVWASRCQRSPRRFRCSA